MYHLLCTAIDSDIIASRLDWHAHKLTYRQAHKHTNALTHVVCMRNSTLAYFVGKMCVGGRDKKDMLTSFTQV